MRSILTTLALFTALTAFAGPGHSVPREQDDRSENRLAFLTDYLQLTDVQVIWFRGAQDDHLAHVDGIRAQYAAVELEMARRLTEARRAFSNDAQASGAAVAAIRQEYRARLAPMHEAIRLERDRFQQSLNDQLTASQRERFGRWQPATPERPVMQVSQGESA